MFNRTTLQYCYCFNVFPAANPPASCQKQKEPHLQLISWFISYISYVHSVFPRVQFISQTHYHTHTDP